MKVESRIQVCVQQSELYVDWICLFISTITKRHTAHSEIQIGKFFPTIGSSLLTGHEPGSTLCKAPETSEDTWSFSFVGGDAYNQADEYVESVRRQPSILHSAVRCCSESLCVHRSYDIGHPTADVPAGAR